MNIDKPLFYGNLICLASIDHEKDAEIETKWTHEAAYMRMISPGTVRPLAPTQIRKKYEAIEKQIENDKNMFYFTIRKLSDDRLIGFVRINRIEWSNGTGDIQMGIGQPEDRRHGFGSEALQLMLRYAFNELNLLRLSALVPEYNGPALGFFKKAGFVEEVRRRQALNRDGRRWDFIHLGLLGSEYVSLQEAKK
jgi:RimJ/RimL family protein N-acetyltransferase